MRRLSGGVLVAVVDGRCIPVELRCRKRKLSRSGCRSGGEVVIRVRESEYGGWWVDGSWMVCFRIVRFTSSGTIFHGVRYPMNAVLLAITSSYDIE